MTSTKKRLVIIGGVAAGMSAAAKARRSNPDLDITVFEKGEWISYSACGLPYLVGGLVEGPQRLVARTVEQFAQQGITVKLHHTVTEIHPARHTITVVDGAAPDQPIEVPYDTLLIATGARPRRPNVAGVDLEGVFNLYVMTDALAMQEYISKHQPRHAVIVGGGYIGLEMAENLAHLGLKIHVVQRPPQLFSHIDKEIAEEVAKELERNNVDLSLCDSVLETCESDHGRVSCAKTSQGRIQTDLLLLSTGIQPNVEVFAQAGGKLGETGAIAVDEYMRTNLEDIYAAGDCAEHLHRLTGKADWVPLGTTANKQGRIAGENIAGGEAAFKGILGTAITRVFNLGVGMTGLNEAKAQAAGFDYATAVIDSTDIAGYYPGAGPLRVKIIAERGTGRLLGGQVIGTGGVDKRTDVLATALHNEMNVEELSWLDLGYVPPYNSVWDPVHVAAQVVAKKV